MKKNAQKVLFMAVVFFMSQIGIAQNGPKISFDQTIIDYGEIEYNSDGIRIWHFKNEGDQPLIITSVKGSCGCTVAKYPKVPITPGKESTIKIKYDTKRKGTISKTVSITTNEPQERNFHVVTIIGKVKPPEESKK